MLITSEPGEFYAVGFHGEGVVLVAPGESWYFTDSRYIEAAQNEVELAQVSLPEKGSNYRKMADELVKAHGWKAVGFEESYMTVAAHRLWTDGLSAELKPASDLLAALRASKDPEEIEAMTAAQRIAERALEETLKILKPGITEKEIAAYLEYKMVSFGAEKKSFDTIIASGPNGSMPHAVPSDRKVQKGEFVTIDFGCKVNGYCSDTTRTVAVGEPTEEMPEGVRHRAAGPAGGHCRRQGRRDRQRGGRRRAEGHRGRRLWGILRPLLQATVWLEIHENPNFARRMRSLCLPGRWRPPSRVFISPESSVCASRM